MAKLPKPLTLEQKLEACLHTKRLDDKRIKNLEAQLVEAKEQLAEARIYWQHWLDNYDKLWDEKAVVEGRLHKLKAREVNLRGERDFFKKMMGRTKVGKLRKALEECKAITKAYTGDEGWVLEDMASICRIVKAALDKK